MSQRYLYTQDTIPKKEVHHVQFQLPVEKPAVNIVEPLNVPELPKPTPQEDDKRAIKKRKISDDDKQDITEEIMDASKEVEDDVMPTVVPVDSNLLSGKWKISSALFNYLERKAELEKREKDMEEERKHRKQDEMQGKIIKKEPQVDNMLEELYEFYLGPDAKKENNNAEKQKKVAHSNSSTSNPLLIDSFKGTRNNFVKTTLKGTIKKRFKAFKNGYHKR